MKIKVLQKGSFSKTEKFMNRVLRRNYMNILSDYGQIGVQLLQNATPKDSGETANAWSYEIEKGDGQITLAWTNDHENKGVSVIILLIYGHGLANGGYVQGNDFVTPTIMPFMQELADKAWKEVTK